MDHLGASLGKLDGVGPPALTPEKVLAERDLCRPTPLTVLDFSVLGASGGGSLLACAGQSESVHQGGMKAISPPACGISPSCHSVIV